MIKIQLQINIQILSSNQIQYSQTFLVHVKRDTWCLSIGNVKTVNTSILKKQYALRDYSEKGTHSPSMLFSEP